jgi:SnoaL-like domain
LDLDDSGRELGRRFIEGLVARNWDDIEACLQPDVRFRAVVPNETTPFRDWIGPGETLAQLQRWFADSDVFEIDARAVESVADVTHASYGFHGHRPDGWYVIEQHLYFEVDDLRISRMRLVCSGFRDIPAPA